MARSKYTDDQKAEALRLYETEGPAEAARRTGINKNTIASWAARKGLQTDAPARLAAAVEMARLTREEKRKVFRDELIDSMLARLRSMDAEMTIVTKKGDTLTIPVSPQGQRDLSTAVKNLTETLRLELGEATDIREDVRPYAPRPKTWWASSEKSPGCRSFKTPHEPDSGRHLRC